MIYNIYIYIYIHAFNTHHNDNTNQFISNTCYDTYIYIYIIYIYIYIYIKIVDVTPYMIAYNCITANLCTNVMDFRGFDSNTILILRGGIPRLIWDVPESLSQAILVGIMLAGRLGVSYLLKYLR